MSFLFSIDTKEIKDKKEKISKSVKDDLYEVISVHELDSMILDYCFSYKIALDICSVLSTYCYLNNNIVLTEYENYIIFIVPKHVQLHWFSRYKYIFKFYWFGQFIFSSEIDEDVVSAIKKTAEFNLLFKDDRHILYDFSNTSFTDVPTSLFFSKKCFL